MDINMDALNEVVDGVKKAAINEELPKQKPKEKAPKAKKGGNASADAKPLEVCCDILVR